MRTVKRQDGDTLYYWPEYVLRARKRHAQRLLVLQASINGILKLLNAVAYEHLETVELKETFRQIASACSKAQKAAGLCYEARDHVRAEQERAWSETPVTELAG